jgi:hypothetical protein
MIIDRTGRELKPGQIIEIPVLALTGAMVPAQIIEISEPSGLTLPNSVTQAPPFVGVQIMLKLIVIPLGEGAGQNSKLSNMFLCDNTYLVQDAPASLEGGPSGPGAESEPKGLHLIKK